MKRPGWVRKVEGFHQGLFFLYGLGLLDLIGIEQCLDLRTQCFYASNVDVFGCLPFAHHFGMDITQGEHEGKDDDRKGIHKKEEKREPHVCSQHDNIKSLCSNKLEQNKSDGES